MNTSAANIIQAKGVIRWLKTQPATRRFNYFSNTGCLFASFAKNALRLKGERVSCLCTLLRVGRKQYAIPHRTEAAISNLNAMFTAGQALKALRKL